MPITKVGQVITETPLTDKDQFDRTGTVRADEFAICDAKDRLKQIQFDPSAIPTNTTLTLKGNASQAANITITMPATSGTLATSSGVADAFNVVTPITGTSPTASGESTLTLATTTNQIGIAGNSGTNTVTLTLGSGAAAALGVSGTNSGDVTLTAVGSTPGANAASLSGQALTLQPADGSNPGVVTAGTQTIGGAKTFSGAISASNLSGTNTGDVTLAAIGSTPSNNGASLSGQVLTLQPADNTHGGIIANAAQTIPNVKTFNNITYNQGQSPTGYFYGATFGAQSATAMSCFASGGTVGFSFDDTGGFDYSAGYIKIIQPSASSSRTNLRVMSPSGQTGAIQTWEVNGTAQATLTANGTIKHNTVGSGVYIKEGSNAMMGTATLSGGTITVSNTAVTANSRIFLTDQNGGANIGSVYISARTAGTSFTITSTNVLDASPIAWMIVEPA